MTMTNGLGPGPDEIPPALAAISLDALAEMEARTGRPFGKVIEELASGEFSIATMRELVRLVEPDRELATLGELMAAAAELLPKGQSPGQA
jgi:hypothetical protein